MSSAVKIERQFLATTEAPVHAMPASVRSAHSTPAPRSFSAAWSRAAKAMAILVQEYTCGVAAARRYEELRIRDRGLAARGVFIELYTDGATGDGPRE